MSIMEQAKGSNPWYNYQFDNAEESPSSMIRNINEGMINGQTGNIGAFRNSLQWRKNTAGGVGTLVDNFSKLAGKQVTSAQRLKYGRLRWDSPEAQAILGKAGDSLMHLADTEDKTFTGLLGDVTEGNFVNMIGAILGGAGTSGVTMKDEAAAIKNLLFSKVDFSGAKEAVKAVAGNIKDLAQDSATNEMVEYPTDNKGSFSWFDMGILGKLASKTFNTTMDAINYVYENAPGAFKERMGSALNWIKDSFAVGIPFSVIIKGANYIGGKMLGYCLRMTDVYNMGKGGATDISRLRSRVMNLPPAMTDVIDPNGRVYNNNVIACQHILSIIPGTLDYDGFKWTSEWGITNAAIASELAAFETDNAASIVFDATSALASILDISDRTGQRLGIFKPEVMKFSRVYMTAMGRLLSRLSPAPAVSMTLDKSVIETSGWGAFEIGIGTNTTLTESGSNSFANSLFDEMMAGTSSKVNEITKNIRALTGMHFSAYDRSGNSSLDAVMHGNKLNTPKFWESSDFSRSYTFNFRLESPYGDTESVLNYVYKPFIALLSCSLPISVSTYGYTTPFVIRADCPGWFSIDCGYVSSIDFRRAPDEGAFNASGLATAIEVTLSITDIYPALSLSIGAAGLSKNYPELTFLDSLAGMDYKEIYTNGSYTAKIRSQIAALRTMPGIIANTAMSKASKSAWGGFGLIGIR